jgi:protein kinase A
MPLVMLKNLFKPSTIKQNGTKPLIEEKKEETQNEEIPKLPEYKLSDFELFDTIGTGTFGKVKVCQLKETKEFFAIKILKKSRILELHQVDHLKNEKQILTLVRDCPFFVKLFSCFKDEENIYFIMEYVQGGELFSWSKYFKGMEEKVNLKLV